MEKYTINYNNGFIKEVEANDLDEVKQIAYDNMGFTQANIDILNEDGEIITTAFWNGVEAEDDDQTVLEVFGSHGYYQIWTDELENM